MAKEFGLSPARAAWEIDHDPEQLALELLPLLRYADAYEVWERADANELKGWRGVRMMDRVNEIGGALAEEEMRARAQEIEA